MPAVPPVSPATGNPTSSTFIHTFDSSFIDNHGRRLLLRGVNLSGACKAPVGRPSHLLDQFWERAEAGNESFIGRPLNIDDGTADVHLARLRGWGFNMLRFAVTWEALEHEGPGKYDEDFMDYIVRVLRKCKQYGFRVYIDPHQDVWSRFSGGSGAPFWTLPACGINHRHLTATQAALLHNEYPTPSNPDPTSFPAMIWSTNYGRLISETVFTLLFAGRTFAPKCIIDDMNIQDYLQNHFVGAYGRLADRIRESGNLLDDCVIAWDSMNEPSEGLIQWEDLNVFPKGQGNTLKKGPSPTPAQSLRLGMGQAQTIENWTFGALGPSRNGTVTIDPRGIKVWGDASFLDESPDGFNSRWGWKRNQSWELGSCIWASHGVWDVETGYILRPDYFKYFPQGPSAALPVEFLSDFWTPFFTRYTKRIRSAHPEAIMFVQPPVFAPPPKGDKLGEDVLQGRSAYSPHYYDGLTLITKHWNWFNADTLGLLRGKYSSTLAAVKVGSKAIRSSFRDQLGYLKDDALDIGNGGYPTIIGEIGTPFDMDRKRSYGYTDGGRYIGDYESQQTALDASLNGTDGKNALSFSIWNYCPEGGWEWGDRWNGEDLSLWTDDDLNHKSFVNDKDCSDRLNVDDDSDEEGVYPTLGVESIALLRKRGKEGERSRTRTRVTTASAAASSLSLHTLSPPHSPAPPSATPPSSASLSRREQAGYSPHISPFEFLTNGARAWKAFNRPWPIAVVGRIMDLDFEIEARSKVPKFRCVIRVERGDRIGGGNGNIVPTEIFLPLVHFGSDKSLHGWIGEVSSGLDGRSVREGSELLRNANNGGSEETLYTPSKAPVRYGDGFLNDDISITREGADSHKDVFYPEVLKATANLNQTEVSRIELFPPDSTDLLDVEVKVSEGTWRVRGQVLEWMYDQSMSPSAESRDVWIEVIRRGGPIRIDQAARGQGGTPEVGDELICQRVCDDCRIM